MGIHSPAFLYTSLFLILSFYKKTRNLTFYKIYLSLWIWNFLATLAQVWTNERKSQFLLPTLPCMYLEFPGNPGTGLDQRKEIPFSAAHCTICEYISVVVLWITCTRTQYLNLKTHFKVAFANIVHAKGWNLYFDLIIIKKKTRHKSGLCSIKYYIN